MGPFDIIEGLYDTPAPFDDRELKARIARIEKALGIGPPPAPPRDKRTTSQRLSDSLKAFYTKEFFE